MDIASFSSIFAHWPTDWILIGAFAAFAALDAMRSGPARAAALVCSLPAALLILQALPKAFLVGGLSAQFATPLAQLGIFIVLAAILYIAIHRIIFTFSHGTGPIQALIIGLATAIVLAVVLLQISAFQSVWHFGDQVQAVFGAAYAFWWLLGSYIALAAVRS